MNRALRAAAMGVLLLSPVAVSACSAGQVAQTAEQNRDKIGGTATAGDITVRNARLAYPITGKYQRGGEARLVVAISNGGQTDDTLVSVKGKDFGGAQVTGSGPTASGAPPATPTGSAAPTASAALNVPVPANSNVYVGSDGPVVTLTGLTQDFAPGQALDVTMTFQRAGELSVQVLVGSPTRDLPRGEPFDFNTHLDEKQTGGGSA